MKTIFARSALLVAAIFVPASAVFAQNNLQVAHVSGSVTDSTGSAVAAVQLSLTPEGASARHAVVASSDAAGSYTFEVPPGKYLLRAERPAFVTREVHLSLAPSESRKLDVRLELAQLSDQVVVTATTLPEELERTPAPVDLVTLEEIEQRQAVSLPDLLSTQTGIAVSRTGAIGGLVDVFIDGGDSNFTKVLIDGAPINEPGGFLNYSNLTLDNVDKVEIVHGAESALYGTDAMSGVIQVISHRGTTRIPEVDLFG